MHLEKDSCGDDLLKSIILFYWPGKEDQHRDLYLSPKSKEVAHYLYNTFPFLIKCTARDYAAIFEKHTSIAIYIKQTIKTYNSLAHFDAKKASKARLSQLADDVTTTKRIQKRLTLHNILNVFIFLLIAISIGTLIDVQEMMDGTINNGVVALMLVLGIAVATAQYLRNKHTLRPKLQPNALAMIALEKRAKKNGYKPAH